MNDPTQAVDAETGEMRGNEKHWLTDEELEIGTFGESLEEAVAETGATVVSYLDVSLAMDAAGEDFFAEGELGDLHPGPAAYPRIAEAIAAGVDDVVAASADDCGTA